MAQIDIQGSGLGNALSELMTAPDIEPGDSPSYEICKTLYLYHPLGLKMAESPIAMAQSQPREISVQGGPEERVKEQFIKEWAALKCDDIIYNVATMARVYGLASVAMVCPDVKPEVPIDVKKLAQLPISFSVFDPLNTAGSLVLNQDPLSYDFMKVTTIAVSGVPFHRSRSCTLMNERPVYIAYTSSAFGFVGRSVYQRALFPLKSFIQTLITDDLVTKKAGVFIAKLGAAGAIIDNVMQSMAGLKRIFIKASTNGNVISIGKDEFIETLNMQNIDKAFGGARKNILENIAVSADMPAKLLNSETFAEGFGEGTEDAKQVARYIDRVRRQLEPIYVYFDRIVQYRAWNEDFYKLIQKDFEEYKGVSYEEAFFKWANSFTAKWPNLLTEPDSEKAKSEKVKLEAIIDLLEALGPMLDPENKATLVGFVQDVVNTNKTMFPTPLEIDIEELRSYVPPVIGMGGEDGEEGGEESKGDTKKPRADSARRRRRQMPRLDADQIVDLVSLMDKPETKSIIQRFREAA